MRMREMVAIGIVAHGDLSPEGGKLDARATISVEEHAIRPNKSEVR